MGVAIVGIRMAHVAAVDTGVLDVRLELLVMSGAIGGMRLMIGRRTTTSARARARAGTTV